MQTLVLGSLIGLLAIIGIYAADEKVTVWSFRTDNADNSIVTASFKGQPRELSDFTLCFRYRILYFNHQGDGINIITAKTVNEKDYFRLKVYSGELPNLLRFHDSEGVQKVIWFEAYVPARQWNTMCVLRDAAKNKLRIYQNNGLVYSMGECVTVVKPNWVHSSNPAKEDVSCIKGSWYLKSLVGHNKEFQGCTKDNWSGYWCPISISSPDRIYNWEHDPWGDCSYGCMEGTGSNSSTVVLGNFSSSMLLNMNVGFSSNPKDTLKAQVTEFYIWDKALTLADIHTFGTGQCRQGSGFKSPFVAWTNWQNFWTLTEDPSNREALSTTSVNKADLFMLDTMLHTRLQGYIGFSELKNFEDGIRLCKSFGGRLPLPASKKEENDLWSVMADPKLNCKERQTWLGVTDMQKEGQFLNVTR
jgi:hypothetical protein